MRIIIVADMEEPGKPCDGDIAYVGLNYPNLPIGHPIQRSRREIMQKDKNIAAVEGIFEKTRARFFPDRPSRLNCIYLSPTLEAARSWSGTIYMVCYKGKTFVADAEQYTHAIDEYRMTGDRVKTQEYAKAYWSGEQSFRPTVEILLDGTANIISKHEG